MEGCEDGEGLQHLSYEQRLRELGGGGEKAEREPHQGTQTCKGGCQEDGTKLFRAPLCTQGTCGYKGQWEQTETPCSAP